MNHVIKFIYYYIRSMRLYYCFVSGAAVFAGMAVAHHFSGQPWRFQDWIILAIGFFSWGINQIFNDAFDMREDAVNAPHRAMVSGKLACTPAMLLSAILMLVAMIISYLISPWTLLPIALGIGLNLLYSFCKGIPVLDCVIYGLAMIMCTVYGLIGAGAYQYLSDPRQLYFFIFICILLLPSHIFMCYNSYFKDAKGDFSSGKRTLHTRFNHKILLWISVVLSVLYSIFISRWALSAGNRLFDVAALVIFLLLILWNYINLSKQKYHIAVLSNCLLCVAYNLYFAVVFSRACLWFAVGTLPIIILISQWYQDEKE